MPSVISPAMFRLIREAKSLVKLECGVELRLVDGELLPVLKAAAAKSNNTRLHDLYDEISGQAA